MNLRMLTCVLCVLGCGGGTSNGPKTELIVGTLVPRTGPNQNVDWVHAVELAHNHINQALLKARNPKGLTFTRVERDSGSNRVGVCPAGTTACNPSVAGYVPGAKELTHQLVEMGAKIVTAETSPTGLGANQANYDNLDSPALMPAKTAVVCFACTNGDLNNPLFMPRPTDPQEPSFAASYHDSEEWFFRTAPTVFQHSEIIARNMQANHGGDANGDGVVKIILITSNDNSGLNSLEPARVLLLRLLGPDTKVESLIFDQNATAESVYQDVLTKAHDGDTITQQYNETTKMIETVSVQTDGAPPDYLWNRGLPLPTINLVRAYKNGGYTTPMVHHDPARRNTFLQALGDQANGQEGASVLQWERNESGEAFRVAQREVTGQDPTSFEANAYDAVVLAELALFKAATALDDPASVTNAQVRDALKTLNDPAGAAVGAGVTSLTDALNRISQGEAINYDGASGPCDFDSPSPGTATTPPTAGGNVLAKAAYWKIIDKQYVDQQVYDCTQPGCPLTQGIPP
jgi:hypothetical protein